MKKAFIAIILAVSLSVICVGVYFGFKPNDMGDKGRSVDYSLDNDYEYEVIDTDESLTYSPVGVEPQYGLVFYVGTAIDQAHYSYLAIALAKQGYIVVLPKMMLNMAYAFYSEQEIAFENHKDVRFFIGGHSQGGGAAVKRVQENSDKVLGAILYAPLCYAEDSIKDAETPTLLIEATKDNVLTADMKADAKSRLPTCYSGYMLDGCHMSFSTFDDDGILGFFGDGPLTEAQKAEQKQKTIEYTLEFMKTVVLGQYPMPI